MLRVLTYHRVGEAADAPGLNPSLISATPEAFERQMRYLAERYQVVSVEEVFHAIERGDCLHKRATLVTFDDAYRDFAEVAWPTMKRYRIPATLFLATAFPDQGRQGFWWDRLYRAVVRTSRSELHCMPLGRIRLGQREERCGSLRKIERYLKSIPHTQAMALVDQICDELGEDDPGGGSVLSWDELQKLVGDGVTLGAHTRTHPILTQIPPEQVRQEITGSQQDLRRKIGKALPIFCYPDGAHNETIVDILREEGFKIAFSTLDGQNDLSCADLFRLRRTNITPRTSLPIFRLRMTRAGAYFDEWRHRRREGVLPG